MTPDPSYTGLLVALACGIGVILIVGLAIACVIGGMLPPDGK